jgi:hypothetical protein
LAAANYSFLRRLLNVLIVILAFCIATYISGAYAQNVTEQQKTGLEQNPVLVQLIIGILSTGASLIAAWFIVRGWQHRKEKSDIRKMVLSDFQTSFKDYIILMDTFIAKIVNGYSSINPDPNKELPKLSNNLPYGYDYSELKNDHPAYNDAHKMVVIFPSSKQDFPATKYADDFKTFEQQFYTKRAAITKFLSELRQYYAESDELNKELDLMWAEIMASRVLISNIMKVDSEKRFFELLDQYNNSANRLFKGIKDYDRKLSREKIIIK